MKKILHAVEIAAPRNKVFKAITTQTGLSSWWTTKVRVEEGVGGLIDFQFLEGFNPDMKVTQLIQTAPGASQILGIRPHRFWKPMRST